MRFLNWIDRTWLLSIARCRLQDNRDLKQHFSWKYVGICLKVKGNTFLEECLGKIESSKIVYEVTVTSYLNQSQHSFVILLEILSCTFVPNLSKIGFFMFPWQHILETALMWNGAIQLSNDVTVTLFLNQSLQNFEVFLEMISSTSTKF